MHPYKEKVMFKLFSNFFYPSESGAGSGTVAIEDKSLGKEDTIKFLSEDDETSDVIDLEPKKGEKKVDDKEDKKDDKEDKEKEENEPDELKELEEEIEEVEPDDEKFELVTPVRRKEILAKYPNVFKDFPYLEKAYYREQEFTKLFPTIDDAKEISEKAQVLDDFEKDLVSGNTEKLLLGIKNTDPKAFLKIVDNYLPTLATVDEKAYHHVIGNTIKHTIMAMAREAKTSKNESLEIAAQLLNQFVFGSSDFSAPSKLAGDEKATDEDTKKLELEQREQAILQRDFDRATEDLNTKLDKKLKATIAINIDPKDTMTDYVKKNATREAMEAVTSAIEQDSRFKIILDKLWENAIRNNFDRNSVNRIEDAWTSKAKSLLPSVIKRARNEALKGMGKRVSEDKEEREEKSRPSSKPENRGSKSAGESKGKVPAGMSTLDFLNQED